MKNLQHFLILFFLLSVAVCQLQAQTKDGVTYKLVSDLAYRKGQPNLDDYQISRCKLDIYYPVNVPRFATIVWFHGGSLTEGEKFIPEELKNRNIAIVSVNYRLSPKAQHPAYIDDAAVAVAWTFKNIEAYGGDSQKIFVAGHSAGAYLTLMLGLDKQWLAKYEVDANNIAALFPLSAQTVTHATIRNEMALNPKVPLVDQWAPLNLIRKDAPPMMLVTGGRDLEIPNRYNENALFYSALKNIGDNNVTLYELNGFDHGTMVDPACFLILHYLKAWEKARE